MKLILITFSPTGGTQKCAEALAKGLINAETLAKDVNNAEALAKGLINDEAFAKGVYSDEAFAKGVGSLTDSIDLSKRDLQPRELTAKDVAIIAVPSYGGRVPALATERLKSINGKGAKAIIMAVYGNRAYEDTLVELSDVVAGSGFTVIAAVSAVARHSIVNKIATERPDAEDVKTLEEFGKQIGEKIVGTATSTPTIPGNRPYKKAGSAMAPKTNKKCNDCGKCAVLCPSGAISKENPKKIDTKVCINCMRCVEICPNDAKYIPSLMLWLVGKFLKKPCASRKAPELFI